MNPFNFIAGSTLKDRFRGFLPVVIDVETAGLDASKHALLEMCAVILTMDKQGNFIRQSTHFEHILPFKGAELDPASLAFNQIDPYQPLRFAVDEKIALQNLIKPINEALKASRCHRAVLVGHNAWFDLLFVREALQRTKLKSPFHAFTCFDTATLAGFMYGQTVLAKAVKAAGLKFDPNEAHSAIYDAEKTADLFCMMLNTWKQAMEKSMAGKESPSSEGLSE